jgi:hypothetical protein
MNPTFRAGLLTGFIAGAALAGFAVLILRPHPLPEPARPALAQPPAEERVTRLQEENRRLSDQVAELKTAKPPAPVAETRVEKPATPPPDLKDRFVKLAGTGLAAFQSPEFEETLKAVKESGRPAVDFLTDILRTSASATERLIAAVLLERAGDASAVPALAEALKGDKDDIVRTMASHALALLGAPDAEAPLRAAATGDSNLGVRINSAYGLAKLKQEDGLRILMDAYGAADTPAEYRLAILGGLADVAAPSTAPLFRRILADSKEAGYLLTAIQALEKMKDTGALPALELFAASTQPDLVKQSAARAVESIRK